MKVVTYVEIDVDYCALSSGVAPCTADGPTKCFNSLATCQDRPNFSNDPLTIRFAVPTSHLPTNIEAIPSIDEVAFSPSVISLGEDLGQRATLAVTFIDHPHSDTGGLDKYHSERSYNPYKQGTFWGKFRARQPYLRGRSLRLITGVVGQSLAQMETRHYVIDSFDGPTLDGKYKIIAQDVLKLADGDRARAPRLNSGFLTANLAINGSSATLSPAGVGNAEYPSSGHVAIGGREVCSYTRSEDTLTLTRAQLGTVAVAHSANDRVQRVLTYVGQDPANILYDLLVNYADVDPSFISLPAWQTETSTYLQRVYTGYIAEPTPVKTLISEIIEQAALAVWWNDITRKIGLQVLRGIDTTAAKFTESQIVQGSFDTKEQPNTRISQIHTYFAQRSPLEPQDEPNNYRSVERVISDTEQDYGSSNIKVIYSRWIPLGGRTTAQRLNNLLLGRFVTPPRRFNFSLMRGADSGVTLAGGYQLSAPNMQLATGEVETAPIQVVRLRPGPAMIDVEAEEARFQHFDEADLANRVIIIDVNTLNFNLRTAHDQIFPVITGADVGEVTLTCIVQAGVIVGSALTSQSAFEVGTWPTGFDIVVRVLGRIQGRGGNGGAPGVLFPTAGLPGGVALRTRFPIDLEVASGQIWGGAGGGAGTLGAGGGGGAGYLPGDGGTASLGNPGQPGTTELGGAGAVNGSSTGASGGGPGLAGGNASIGVGGVPGAAIDGISYVTVTSGPGDRRGPQIN